MRTILVGPDIEENLSLGYLAAVLRNACHECSIVPFNYRADVDRTVRGIMKLHPDLIGLSLVAQRRCRDFCDLVSTLRQRGFRGHITAGGHFASLRAREILTDEPGIDSILHHEGEHRIIQLARWLDSPGEPPESLDGISWRDSSGRIRHRPPRYIARLDDLPRPARRRPDRTLGLNRAPLVSSRGCAGNCSFCSINAWHRQVPGARLRLRSPVSVAEEMVSLHRQSKVRVFIFHDDDFIQPNPEEALARCRMILDSAERGLGRPFAFVIKCRPDDVREDLFRYLTSKGLVRTYVGIETHSQRGLRTLRRNVSPEENERALATLSRLGAYACFNLLLFDPDTTMETLGENLAFLREQLDRPFDIARAELYAGSALEKRMLREGRAIGDYRGYDYRITDPRVEAVFRLFAKILWHRHFAGGSVLHRVQDLGYRQSLLRRFYPDAATKDLESDVSTLIREINSDTIGYIERLCRVVGDRGADLDSSWFRNFEEDMKREVSARVNVQSLRLNRVSADIETRALLARLGLPTWSAGQRRTGILGRVAAALPYAALAIGAVSCTDGCTRTTVCDPPPPPMSFSSDIEPHLDQSCATSRCHDTQTAAAGLDLSAGESYSRLVDVPSTQLPAMDRVEPGEPDSSYLLHKLQGTQATAGGSGDRMPKDKPPDESLSWKVRQWISEGAEDD